MPKTPEQLARKRARKAEKARRRRALKGAVPRTESRAAQLRDLGVSPDAFYSRQRRTRLRDDEVVRDGVSYPYDGIAYPLDIEAAPAIDAPHGHGVADHAAGPNTGAIKLYSDLWGGWVPVPAIRSIVSAELPIDVSPSRADRLIAAVASLQGGQDPDHQDVLRWLVEAAEARERTR